MEEKVENHGIKYTVYSLLNYKSESLASKIINAVIIAMILINAVILVLQSIQEIQVDYGYYFKVFNYYSIAFFTIEYLLRTWSITCDPKYKRPILGRLKYAFTIVQLIDLLAILPFYLAISHIIDLRVLKVLRIFKLLRIFRITRYVSALAIIVLVLKRKSAELIISLVLLCFLLLISSTTMYYVEHNAQPNQFSSVLDAMWWSVITLSTVGYGDVYPITTLGRIVGGIIAVIGIGFFAMPTGILASGFSEVMEEKKFGKQNLSKNYCPTCGQEKKMQ